MKFLFCSSTKISIFRNRFDKKSTLLILYFSFAVKCIHTYYFELNDGGYRKLNYMITININNNVLFVKMFEFIFHFVITKYEINFAAIFVTVSSFLIWC